MVLCGAGRTAHATCGDYLHPVGKASQGAASDDQALLHSVPEIPSDMPQHRCSGPLCSSEPIAPVGPRPLPEWRPYAKVAIVGVETHGNGCQTGRRAVPESDRRQHCCGRSIFRPPELG